MKKIKDIVIACIMGSVIVGGCNSGKTTDSADEVVQRVAARSDTASAPQKVSMVISSIPFPISILDTLHFVHAKYQSTLANPVENSSLYSQSNSQAINLGIYGADLSYVISFEQFGQVGKYMKATKYLADKTGVPMAFTEDIIARCEKNSNNKDSLTVIVYGSYSLIDRTLKSDKRKATEALVLAGGWVEALYLTTQSMEALISPTDRQGGYYIILEQSKYLDVLLNQLDLVTDSPYCQDISTGLHEIRSVYNNVTSSNINDEVIKTLKEKVENLRARITKGGNV